MTMHASQEATLNEANPEDSTPENASIDELSAEDTQLEDRKRKNDWILVNHNKGSRPKPAPKLEDESSAKATTSLPPLSKEIIAGQHTYIVRDYKVSSEYLRLKSIIGTFNVDTSKNTVLNGGPVRKAVCLGIGSFDPENGSWHAKERAHIQLAAFLLIVEEIQKSCSQAIECIFQEPAFQPCDIDYLTSMGHKVVESPAAFDVIDSTTFVFGIHLYHDVYTQIFKNGELPVLFIGTGWETWSEVNYRWAPEECNLEALMNMKKTHKKFDFPDYENKNIFFATSIYWE